MLEVLVRLDAAILRPLVIQCPCWVKEGNVSVSAGAEVNFLQLQFVCSIQVLLRVPQHPAIQSLTCRGQQRNRILFLLFVPVHGKSLCCSIIIKIIQT